MPVLRMADTLCENSAVVSDGTGCAAREGPTRTADLHERWEEKSNSLMISGDFFHIAAFSAICLSVCLFPAGSGLLYRAMEAGLVK